jgi:hypothetical protein
MEKILSVLIINESTTPHRNVNSVIANIVSKANYNALAVFRQLLKQDFRESDKIYELLAIINPNSRKLEPLIDMLLKLPLKKFEHLCPDLRTTDINKCNKYADVLIGNNSEEFWNADPDAVYNGIFSIMESLRTGKDGREIGMIFKLLMGLVTENVNEKLTNLFYSSEFHERLEILRKYGIVYTIESGERFFMHTSFYAYMDDRLADNKDRYKKLKNPSTDNSFHKFITRVVEKLYPYTAINSLINDKEFKDELFVSLIDMLQGNPLPQIVARVYAILLIYFDNATLADVNKKFNRSDNKSQLLDSYATRQYWVEINVEIGLISNYLSTSERCYAKAALGRLNKFDNEHLNDIDKLLCGQLRKFCTDVLEK